MLRLTFCALMILAAWTYGPLLIEEARRVATYAVLAQMLKPPLTISDPGMAGPLAAAPLVGQMLRQPCLTGPAMVAPDQPAAAGISGIATLLHQAGPATRGMSQC